MLRARQPGWMILFQIHTQSSLAMFRNLFNAIAQRDYSSTLFELIILALGVFLGLQAESWYSDQRDREDASLYSKRLANEFSYIQRATLGNLEEIERELSALEKLVTVIDSDVGLEESEGRALVEEVAFYDVPPQPSATYVEMVNGAKLDILGDKSLIAKLVSCNDQLKTLRSNSAERNRIFMNFSCVHIAFSLDLQTMPFSDAYDLASQSAIDLRRSYTLARMIRSADKEEYFLVQECATETLALLNR